MYVHVQIKKTMVHGNLSLTVERCYILDPLAHLSSLMFHTHGPHIRLKDGGGQTGRPKPGVYRFFTLPVFFITYVLKRWRGSNRETKLTGKPGG